MRGWIGGLDADKKNFVVYDIKTGQLIRKIFCMYNQSDPTYTLHDGRLYSKHGYVVDLR